MSDKKKEHRYNQELPKNKYNPLSWIHPNAIIGDNCWIGSCVMISENVEISDNVSISCGVKIYDHDTSLYHASEGKVKIKRHKVTIGPHSQIGSNSVIIPKDTDLVIGDHVIIGALSLVKIDVPPNYVMGGNPLRYIDEVVR